MKHPFQKIKDFLVLGKFIQNASAEHVTLGENGIRLRHDLVEILRQSLRASSPEHILSDHQRPFEPKRILNQRLKDEHFLRTLKNWSQVSREHPFSILQIPNETQNVTTQRKLSEFCCTAISLLPVTDDGLNFSLQTYLRSRRMFWKQLFFDPGTHLRIKEENLKSSTPSASIESKIEGPDLSLNLTLESVRFLEKSAYPPKLIKEFPHVRLVESKSFLTSGIYAILLTSVRDRLFIKSTRLALPNVLVPIQVTLVIEGESSRDLLDFQRYLQLLLERENIRVWLPDDAKIDLTTLYTIADQLGIPYTVVIPTKVLENGVVKLRDRETVWFEEIHAAQLTRRLSHIFTTSESSLYKQSCLPIDVVDDVGAGGDALKAKPPRKKKRKV